MIKKITIYFSLVFLIIISSSAINSNPRADTGRTGATGVTCADGSCHNSFGLNSGGGDVTVIGLPASYSPSTAYPISVKINHGAANRLKWGFAIKAVNPTGGAAVGTFSTANTTEVRIASNEATSNTAPSTAASSTFTFTGITWTSPAAASSPTAVKFFFVGNAANGDNTRLNDYIYSGTQTIAILPIKLLSFNLSKEGQNILLKWQVENNNETKYFEIQKSSTLDNFVSIGKLDATTSNLYYYVDAKNQISKSNYRLKMVDKNGGITYSNILSSNNKTNNTIVSTYPNPLKKAQNFNVELLSEANQKVNFSLINLEGKIVSNKTKEILEGFNKVSLNFGNYISTGNYLLTVKMGNQIFEPIKINITE